MLITSHRICVMVEVDSTDKEGIQLKRLVCVECEYIEETCTFGEDADGNRGVRLTERFVLDQFISPGIAKTLNSQQVEDALLLSRQQIEEGRIQP